MIVSLLGLICMLGISSCNYASGGYPYAERYELNVSESVLIEAVQQFKLKNPQLNVPDSTRLKDGRNSAEDHWYHVYFYYPDENQILYTWLRSGDNGHTTFAFVSINDGLEIGNWKEINKDYPDRSNAMHKQVFERRILDKIKTILKNKRTD
ncbi:MAG: hypothetical protein JNL32_08230 [Candidatus Kapabacteria bacterium]|nr:hypothetical protein [Candidatus Kapabacteria bacterium]